MSKILRFRLFQVVLTAVMVIVVHSRECIDSGKRCQLRCCGLSDQMKCRKRCFGIACDSDLDCDKDCCVNSICSSCPLRTTSTTNTDPTTLPPTLNQENNFVDNSKTFIWSENERKCLFTY